MNERIRVEAEQSSRDFVPGNGLTRFVPGLSDKLGLKGSIGDDPWGVDAVRFDERTGLGLHRSAKLGHHVGKASEFLRDMRAITLQTRVLKPVCHRLSGLYQQHTLPIGT